MLYKRILRNTGAVLAGYLILTLVTSIVMRDLSLRHTVFFLVDLAYTPFDGHHKRMVQ